MTQAYIYLRKLVTLAIASAIFILSERFGLSFYISIPVLILAFSVIVSKITGSSPKELFNFQRSEIFFNKGGLRDLIRIPVVLFAFLQDVVVWFIWGLYQIFTIFTDTIFFIKELVFWVLHALIWFLKLLLPFWRVVYKLFIHYLVKWPWWIYRYSFRAIKKTYNWNVLKTSLIGTFFTLLVFHFFYFFDITFEVRGLMYIGILMAFLPLSWIFGEISALRGQNLLFSQFRDIRKQFRNGIETVRGILFLITIFVVLLLAEAGLDWLGWIPKAGIIILGFTLNISFLINATLILLAFTIVFGTLVLPTYRLYNEYSEISFKNNYRLFTQIIRRGFQYISGFVPASFFATVSSIPAIIFVGIVLFLTIQFKNSLFDIKIDKLTNAQNITNEQVEEYRYRKEISHLKEIQQLPNQIRFERGYRSYVRDEWKAYENKLQELKLEHQTYRSETNQTLEGYRTAINEENGKAVINQTRVNELEEKYQNLSNRQKSDIKALDISINNTEIDIEYAKRRYVQLPVVFFLSGLILVVVLTLVFTFFFAYLGNFLYKTYLFRNDSTPAQWKVIIDNERTIDKKQPLLSTTLNIVVLVVITYIIARFVFSFEIAGFWKL